MSTTPTTCPHCGAENLSCGTAYVDGFVPSEGCFERQIAALKEELEQAKAERKWRPIETAPKDGTGIDVWIGGAAGFRIANVYWYQGGWHTFKTSSGSPIFSPLGWQEIASLWMPLPTGPKEAQP